MKRLVAALILSLLALPSLAATGSDPEALIRVSRLMNVLGGPMAPYMVDSIAFTFSVERDGEVAGSRRHVWHPRTGRHELTLTPKDSGPVSIDWNIRTKQGVATKAGEPVVGEELETLLERAWKMWVNDTYWLLMPYKLYEPGVQLVSQGTETIDGKLFDKVRVTFDSVGLTPGDTYWAFISRETGVMDRWAFQLEGREPPPAEWNWVDYRYYGPLFLSSRKESVGSNMAILTDHIVVR